MYQLSDFTNTQANFARKLGSKDKKKRARRIRAAMVIGATGLLGAVPGLGLGAAPGFRSVMRGGSFDRRAKALRLLKRGAIAGTGIGAGLGAGASYLEHKKYKQI